MIRRDGQGFTELERAVLVEFLEDELIIQGLFLLAARRATLASRSDVWTRTDDESSMRVITRKWLPIAMPSSDPAHPRRKRVITLQDNVTVSYQEAGSGTPTATETLSWYCTVGVKEGREKTTDARPTLSTWHYLGASVVTDTPQLGGEWTLSEPSEVWDLVQDDVQRHQEFDRQANTLRELQRLTIFMADQRLPRQPDA